MKTKLLFLFLLIARWAIGQSFSEKSNSIALDYTKPVIATTLPSIVWISPRLERSNSASTSVSFEADVFSDVPLKAIRIDWTNGGETRTKELAVTDNEFKKSIRQPLKLLD